jgi:hypothetical protein
MMSEHPNPRKVTLEDILRLKRSERPDQGFWVEFEERLRAKQLAAIVARRPWWQVDLSRFAVGVRGLRLPIGAVAALAFAFVAVRENPHRVIEEPEASALADGAIDAGDLLASVPSALPRPVVTVDSAGLASVDRVPAGVSEAYEPVSETSEAGVVAEPALTERRSGRVPSLFTAIDQAGGTAQGRFATEGTLAAAAVGGLAGRLLLTPQAAIEPLTQITSPSEGRRARLAALTETSSTETRRRSSFDPRARERILDRLHEDELYLNFSRVGVDRGALSVRF